VKKTGQYKLQTSPQKPGGEKLRLKEVQTRTVRKQLPALEKENKDHLG